MTELPWHAQDDDPLLARLGAGDAEALASIVESERGLLLRSIRARLGEVLTATTDAEDILQDGIVAAMEALPGTHFQSRAHARAWLRTILVRTTATLARRMRPRLRPRRRTGLPSALMEPLAWFEGAPAAGALHDLDPRVRERLRGALRRLGRLPHDQRVVLLARDVLRLELEVAALVANRSKMATSKLHQRARRNLADHQP